jgi:hypothetical protein
MVGGSAQTSVAEFHAAAPHFFKSSKKQNKYMLTDKFLESAEYISRRNQINKEINKTVIKTLPSAEQWRKTKEEKESLKLLKWKHFSALRTAGHNPTKRMNLAEPIKAIVS